MIKFRGFHKVPCDSKYLYMVGVNEELTTDNLEKLAMAIHDMCSNKEEDLFVTKVPEGTNTIELN